MTYAQLLKNGAFKGDPEALRLTKVMAMAPLTNGQKHRIVQKEAEDLSKLEVEIAMALVEKPI